MSEKSIVPGILFSLGIFAFKTGLGLHCFLQRQRRHWSGYVLTGAVAVVYGAVFAAVFLSGAAMRRRRHGPADAGRAMSGLPVILLSVGFLQACLPMAPRNTGFRPAGFVTRPERKNRCTGQEVWS